MAGLGKGLDALLGDSKRRAHRDIVEARQESTEVVAGIEANYVRMLPVDNLKPSEYQPRKIFNENSLEELSESIKQHGLLEPLLVKETTEGVFQIICGERRFRAALKAELKEVPCLVKDVLPNEAYAIALIENIQREDLNPIEQSNALTLMLQESGLTQEQLAETIGKSRSSVANLLRLNALHPDVKEVVLNDKLTLGHAKVLLSVEFERQAEVAQIVIDKQLSVRQMERLVKDIKKGAETKPELEETTGINPETIYQWEQVLSDKLSGAKISFSAKKVNKGKVVLAYSNKEQLDQILGILGLNNN